MPRIAGARVKLGCLVAALVTLVAACGKDRPIDSDGGTSRPNDAGHDAKVEEDAGKDSGVDAGEPPWSEPDGGVMLEDQYCVLRVTAQCDGREDCDNASCCARFEPTTVSFTAMECAPPGEGCDFQRTFPLCHDGQFCAAENDFTCRTSVLIPGDFIGVCLPPSGFLPSQPPTGKEVAGLIDCGSQQCVVGEEQCCMREGFDTRRVRPLRYEPYCAPIGTPCDCSDVDLPPRDGGMTGDEDAGR
jgi:hypothetical protein